VVPQSFPEDVRISVDGTTAAIVHGVENHGVEKVVTLRVANYLIRSNVPAALPVGLNAPVRFSINLDRLHYFDAATGISFAVEQ
jgi:multiple sugar transport system ATP-binding protein